MRYISAKEITTKEIGNFPTFPVKGVNGYGGEQDGDEVLFFEIWGYSKALIRTSVMIPDKARVQWAYYSKKEHSWDISFGVWKSKLKPGELKEMQKSGIYPL